MGMLDRKVVIVTGGGRGIGREHCLELARNGAAVVVNDPGVSVSGDASNEAPADSVVAEIEAAGGTAVADTTSVADWDGCRGIVERAVERFGRLDVVVNNAGILRDRMITSVAEEDFDLVMGVHLKGTYAMTKHACDHWRSVGKAGGQNAGRVVNTVSAAGLWGNVGQSIYGAAKAAIAGLTRITAMEMARHDVTANAISPLAATRMTGTIPSMTDVTMSEDGYEPLHPRASSPVVAYLASDASRVAHGPDHPRRGQRAEAFPDVVARAEPVPRVVRWVAARRRDPRGRPHHLRGGPRRPRRLPGHAAEQLTRPFQRGAVLGGRDREESLPTFGLGPAAQVRDPVLGDDDPDVATWGRHHVGPRDDRRAVSVGRGHDDNRDTAGRVGRGLAPVGVAAEARDLAVAHPLDVDGPVEPDLQRGVDRHEPVDAARVRARRGPSRRRL